MISRWKMYKPILKIVLLLAIVQLVLAGCVSNNEQQTEIELSIVYSSKADFRNDFGLAMSTHFPNVNVNVIELNTLLGPGVWYGLEFQPITGEAWNYEKYVEGVRNANADILFFPEALYPQLVDDGVLKDLTDYADDEELAGIDAMFVDAWLRMGHGKMYFASTSYKAQAIYYNEDLFHQYNISPPTNGMGWDELLEKAT